MEEMNEDYILEAIFKLRTENTVLSVVAVATPVMVWSLDSLMMRGRCPCSPPPLLGIHHGRFDGKLVDKEGV